MVELELLGPQSDGEHLTLTDAEGRRYRLSIDDALRAAVRRDRPQLDSLVISGETELRPKDIQAHLRAGATVAEVAEHSGFDAERIRRYLGPVVAERDWVVQRIQEQRVGREPDAPQLGELVVDRLATRGVTEQSLSWTAVRKPGRPWEVVATFIAGDKEREARWSVDLTTRTLEALDDEARWLSETELSPVSHPRRHLNPVGGPAGRRRAELESEPSARPLTTAADADQDVTAKDASEEPDEESPTDSILAELAANRGTRMELQPELEPHDEDDDGPGLWGAHPAASSPEDARDAHVLSLPRRAQRPGETALLPEDQPALPAPDPDRPQDEAVDSAADDADPDAGTANGTSTAAARGARSRGAQSGAEESTERAHAPAARPAARRSRRRDRRSVPSWDEIVFGARSD